MSYIGQQLPADVFSGYTTDSFTGDGSATTFTLSKAPFSENGLIVVINNVIQKPTTNFTVSGTTLTIVGTAVASGDVIYATHLSGVIPSTLASKLDTNGVSDALILDADADTTISADTDDQIDFKAGGTDVMSMTATGLTINDGTTITTADNTDTLSLISTDADANSGPNLLLDRNSSSTANADVIGVITYRGRNDAGQEVDYVQLETRLADETDGTEDGSFKLKHMNAGTLREYISTNHAEICFNEESIDLDFRVESNANEYALYVDAGSEEVGIGTNPSRSFHTQASANDIIVLHHNAATSGNVFGLQIDFSSTVDDNTSYFFRCVGNDRATVRAVIYSDGDIQNADNSYGSTSDERIKEQIKDANSQWDDIKALKIKNYKLKEDVADKGDSDDLWRLGVVAQDLETAGMNGLVKPEVKLDAESPEVVNGEGNVGDIRDYKGVKYSILYMKAVKALQEAMAKIETLETKVKALEDA